MNGQFDIALLDARPYKDEDFEAAIREGRINELLESLPKDLELSTKNAISHYVVPYLFQMLMSGPAGPGVPFTIDNSGGFQVMTLLDLATEPSFTETFTQYLNWYTASVASSTNATGGTAKRPMVDQVESYLLAKDTQGREAIFCRNRWLFLPSEGVSSSIRSIGIYGNDKNNDNVINDYVNVGRCARVRFKDSGGNPVTINKLNTQAMVVDYTITLVSI
jgi:hypothetical protein